MVWFGALETRQEAVVNVDAPSLQPAAHVVRQYLHIARQHGQLGTSRSYQLQELLLLSRLVAVNRQVVVRDAIPVDHAAHAIVVRYDANHIDRQVVRMPLVEQIVQAMTLFGDGQQHLHSLTGWVKADHHLKPRGHRQQGCRKILLRGEPCARGPEGRAHEKEACLLIAKVRGLGDEGISASKCRCDCSDDTHCIPTPNSENELRLHQGLSESANAPSCEYVSQFLM